MRYQLRWATTEDSDFIFNLLVVSMREYIDQTWGWDEADQKVRHKNRLAQLHYQIISVDDCNVGAIAIENHSAEVFIADIQILPTWQGRGIGAAVLSDIIRDAANKGQLVLLQVLKVNPAKRLYERLGFQQCGETDTHYQMRIEQQTPSS